MCIRVCYMHLYELGAVPVHTHVRGWSLVFNVCKLVGGALPSGVLEKGLNEVV